MRHQDPPTEEADVAIAWLQHLWAGRAEDLDWLTTRTCEIGMAGPDADGSRLDRAGVVQLADAFGEAFEDTRLSLGTLYQREHEVTVQATIETTHAGPLDLTPLGGKRYPATGQRLLLVDQTLAWQILHKRVHGFEVREGLGLGLEQLTQALDLERSAARQLEHHDPEHAWASTNGENGASGETERSAPVPLARTAADGATETTSSLPEPDLPTPQTRDPNTDPDDAASEERDLGVPGIDELRDRVDSVIDEHL